MPLAYLFCRSEAFIQPIATHQLRKRRSPIRGALTSLVFRHSLRRNRRQASDLSAEPIKLLPAIQLLVLKLLLSGRKILLLRTLLGLTSRLKSRNVSAAQGVLRLRQRSDIAKRLHLAPVILRLGLLRCLCSPNPILLLRLPSGRLRLPKVGKR